jgi:hypothetical protein
MIFCSKNEFGVVKADWIASLPANAGFVTRRVKPLEVGKVVAVCPNRGKKQVCKARVVSCMIHNQWLEEGDESTLTEEAIREGFTTAIGWMNWYPAHKIDINQTFRIEMERI